MPRPSQNKARTGTLVRFVVARVTRPPSQTKTPTPAKEAGMGHPQLRVLLDARGVGHHRGTEDTEESTAEKQSRISWIDADGCLGLGTENPRSTLRLRSGLNGAPEAFLEANSSPRNPPAIP